MRREEIKAVYDRGPEAVIDLVEQLFRIIRDQQAQITDLTVRVKELEDRLASDSHNSSKPPSSDLSKKKTQSLREPSGKRPGAQPGHAGHTLRPVDEPDQVIIHPLVQCQVCGVELSAVPAVEYECRQVFDLPPVKVEVTEHRVEIKPCPECGATSAGDFPPGVNNLVQYGAGIKGLAVYLMNYQLLPYRRTREMLEDLLGQPVAEGTLQAALAHCGEELVETEARIKTGVQQSAQAHFDETGLYMEGKRQWLHVASTAQLTHYAPHAKRGHLATDEIGILPGFRGRAMHDGYRSYLSYDCEHALCNAHHLRELTFVEEQSGQAWAGTMKSLLMEIKRAVEATGADGHTQLDPILIQDFAQRYEEILQEGFAVQSSSPALATGRRGPKKQTKAKNLLDRLSRYRRETLAFMYDFDVAFDNNLAERDLRMMKVQQKISGCFRTSDGATTFCRIRSYVSTIRKQGHNVLFALKNVFAGHPIVPVLSG